jgi:hypothetical protein
MLYMGASQTLMWRERCSLRSEIEECSSETQRCLTSSGWPVPFCTCITIMAFVPASCLFKNAHSGKEKVIGVLFPNLGSRRLGVVFQ